MKKLKQFFGNKWYPKNGYQEITEADAEAIRRNLVVMKHYSFPNGSDYDREEMEEGETNGFIIKKRYNQGYYITFPDGSKRFVRFDWAGTGAGADFGIHFCSRNQVLRDIHPELWGREDYT